MWINNFSAHGQYIAFDPASIVAPRIGYLLAVRFGLLNLPETPNSIHKQDHRDAQAGSTTLSIAAYGIRW